MARDQFEAYLDKVFGLSQLLGVLPEGRRWPQHPWRKVLDAAVLIAVLQMPSLLQIESDGVLRSDRSRGQVVAAAAGIEICGSFARCCDACLHRELAAAAHR